MEKTEIQQLCPIGAIRCRGVTPKVEKNHPLVPMKTFYCLLYNYEPSSPEEILDIILVQEEYIRNRNDLH